MTLKARNAISVVIIAALFVGAFAFVWKVVLFGPRGPYEVTAEFRDSGGITKNSDVKIGGVPGGTVEEIDLSKRDTAIVTMKLDDGSYPIGAGARANSRPVNLLGEKYIELIPGDRAKRQPSGTRIPLSRTSRPVELDDTLNILQPDVRARLRILINEAGVGVDGRGTDFNRVLDGLPPALDETQRFVGDFSRDNQALERAIVQSDRVLGAFNRENRGLKRLVSSAATTLKLTSDKRRQIGATLQEAPGTLRQLTSTLSDLGGTATSLEPMSRQLRRTAPQLDRALQELPDFQKDAAPALKAGTQAAPALTRLGREARAPVERLEPVMGRLDTFSERLQPVLNIADKERGFVGLINVMNNWANVIQRADGLGHTFGTFVTVDSASATHFIESLMKDPQRKAARSRPRAPGAPAPGSQPAPSSDAPVPSDDGPKLTLPKLPKLPDLLPKLPAGQQLKDTLGSVGDTVDQLLDGLGGKPKDERTDGQGPTGKLLDYLLGS